MGTRLDMQSRLALLDDKIDQERTDAPVSHVLVMDSILLGFFFSPIGILFPKDNSRFLTTKLSANRAEFLVGLFFLL